MKNGLDWMPLDVYPDSKWELIEAEYGLTGFAVAVKLLQKIYAENGYYLDWSEEALLLFSKKAGLDGDTVQKIVESCVKRGFFDPDLYSRFHILTSAEIQKQFFSAAGRRKEVTAMRQYLLVDPARYCRNEKLRLDGENVSRNEENVYKKSENADISGQSRVEESKGEQSREKKTDASRNESEFSEKPASVSPDVPAACPTKESLSAEYGDTITADYLRKAAGYHYSGNNAVQKAAQWLRADVLSGKLSRKEKRAASFDLDEYDAAVKNFTPVYKRSG